MSQTATLLPRLSVEEVFGGLDFCDLHRPMTKLKNRTCLPLTVKLQRIVVLLHIKIKVDIWKCQQSNGSNIDSDIEDHCLCVDSYTTFFKPYL